MPDDRLARIHDALRDDRGGEHRPARLCRVTKEVVGVSGVGVMLMTGDVPQGSLCSTNPVSTLLEELQLTLGEGPCVDAFHHNRIITEPDLADPAEARWLAFTPRAVDAGARAVFGFPLRAGASRVGALNLYLDVPGHLTSDQNEDATAMADVITDWVLNAEFGSTGGSLADDLDSGPDMQSVVHNAAGMVSVQLGVSVTEAMVRLRARAFTESRLVRELAEDVVARRVRFD
jgi:hypothetical protein